MLSKEENLKEEGIIYLSGEFSKENIDNIIEDILYLNRVEKIEQITLIINSPGGLCNNAFALIDVMEMSKKKIKTVGLGFVCSSGLLVFMTGQERLISDKAMILSHQFSSGVEGKYHELISSRKCEDYLHQRILMHYLKHTDLSKKIIEKELLNKSDRWLTPKETVKFNLADKIINKF